MEDVPEDISYRNVICLGLILDDKGRKMSKSLGNVVEPMAVIEEHGADALRWYFYTATRPGEARRFSDKLVSETLRRFLLTLWNTYSFFVTYANLDGFDPSTVSEGDLSELDRWVLSELTSLVRRVTDDLEGYDPTSSGRSIQQFVDDLSNWYVRRSRRRFWKSGADADKLAAYWTLYTCLVTLTKLLAPFTPFVAEAMYQDLVRSVDAEALEGRKAVEHPTDLLALLPDGAALAEDEAGYAVGIDTAITPELADEGLARELVHRIQNMRKAAGFEIADRISLYYSDAHRLRRVFADYGDYVREETLAEEIAEGRAPDAAYVEEQMVEGEKVTFAVRRVS